MRRLILFLEVYDACKAAAIHDKIMEFPDGYNSKVGHRGVKLSGGELQRVAIARALLRNTKIVLLDEATSMVDMKTERMIQTAFKELGKNRTMFVIALVVTHYILPHGTNLEKPPSFYNHKRR